MRDEREERDRRERQRQRQRGVSFNFQFWMSWTNLWPRGQGGPVLTGPLGSTPDPTPHPGIPWANKAPLPPGHAQGPLRSTPVPWPSPGTPWINPCPCPRAPWTHPYPCPRTPWLHSCPSRTRPPLRTGGPDKMDWVAASGDKTIGSPQVRCAGHPSHTVMTKRMWTAARNLSLTEQ